LCAGESLKAEQKITSEDGSVSLVMQADGNLVMYNGPRQPKNGMWSSQTDYPSSNRKLWQNGILIFQEDFNVAIYPEERATDPKDVRNPKFLINVGHHVGGCWSLDGTQGSGGIAVTSSQLNVKKSWTECDETCRVILHNDCNLAM